MADATLEELEISLRDALIQANAGLALYRAIQGHYFQCPLCKSSQLRHFRNCPVDDYMRALGMANSRDGG